MSQHADLRNLANRPCPVLTLNELGISGHPAYRAAAQSVTQARHRVARILTARAARDVRHLFPTAASCLFSKAIPWDGNRETYALKVVRDCTGAWLWHSADLAAHPIAVARACDEAHGGPVMPGIDDFSLTHLDDLIDEAQTITNEAHLTTEALDRPDTNEFDDVNRREILAVLDIETAVTAAITPTVIRLDKLTEILKFLELTVDLDSLHRRIREAAQP